MACFWNEHKIYGRISSEIYSIMSKVNIHKHIANAQKAQIKIKERNSKFVPGTLTLQVLGSGAPGTPASVYLFTDQTRYLFNCSEGTQRLAHEHRTKLTRLEHIFLTQTNWRCFGGLPGLSLTIQDAGVPNITLHGPPKIGDLFKAMKSFVILKQLNVDAPDCDAGQFYEDSVLRIDYVPLWKETTSEVDVTAMAFVCKCKPRPGTLSLGKCLAKGVPKGPLLGKLKNGDIVTLDDGTVVTPAEVCDPDEPGPTFIVVDLPTIEHLDSLESSKLIQRSQSNELDADAVPTLVLHFSTEAVMKSPRYQEFIERFPSITQHLVLNESNNFSGYIAAHRMQWQLNLIDENIFPILKEPIKSSDIDDESESLRKRIKLLDECKHKLDQSKQLNKTKFIEASPMTCFHLRPNKGTDRSLEATLRPSEYIKEITDLDGVVESLKQLNSNRKIAADRSAEYPKVVFLGTGSCIPNKTRNVSAILVHTSKDSCLLLDAGEGTCGQIVRFYGKSSDDVFRKIKGIYISHLHADHHIGLFGIIQMRQQLRAVDELPLILMAPGDINSWLEFYDENIQNIRSEFTLVPNSVLIDSDLAASFAQRLCLQSLRTCLVPHCPNAFAVALTIDQSEPYKITYSGDTMPCENLVKLGANSSLLIHEATMEDELEEDALVKMHSTVSQAIEQGHKMNAEYTVLTHFSQRYAKIPRIEQELNQNVGIAFDNMEIVPSDLDNLTGFYSTLKIMFAEKWVEMEQKSLKRAHKKTAAPVEDINVSK